MRLCGRGIVHHIIQREIRMSVKLSLKAPLSPSIQLFCDYQWLVRKVLNQHFRSLDHMREDLTQEGYLALWKAARMYTDEKGTFINYAYMAIRREMAWHVNRQYASTCVAVNREREIHNIARFKTYFTGRNGREPSLEEIAEFFETTVTRIEGLLRLEAMQYPRSLDEALTEDEGGSLKEVLRDEDSLTFLQQVEAKIIAGKSREIIRKFVPGNTRRNLTIFNLRYAPSPCDTTMTLAEVGGRLGLTRERVRQLEKAMCETIREKLCS